MAELVVGGWLVDRLVSRGHDPILVRRTVLTVGLVCGAGIGAAGTAGSASVAVVWMCLSLSGLAIAAPVAWSLPGLLAAPGTVGAVSGLMNFADTAATGCGVMFTGWLAQATGSFHAPFLFAVVILAVGASLYRFLLRDTPSPRDDSANALVQRP